MLEHLSKDDTKWRDIAYKICGNKDLSNELVQEMYIKVLKQDKTWEDIEKRVSGYVFFVLKNLFKDYCKKKKDVSINGFHNIEDNQNIFNPTDSELEILKQIDDLDWKQKFLLEQYYDKSLRQIAKEFPLVNYAYAYRQIKEARSIVLKEHNYKFKTK